MSRFYRSANYSVVCHLSQVVGIGQSFCIRFLNRNISMMLSSALLLATLVACAGGGGSSSSSSSSISSSNRIDAIAASCILTDARISSPTSDDDGDGLLNSIDVDDDGDGLIEITTAEQLNQIRYNLLGSNFMLSQVGVGNANGCGNRKDITACNGYELSADISLADYDNWEPIGSCSTNSCANKNTFFKAVFDGNDHIIKDLTITNPVAPYTNAAGLFGAIDSTAQLRNVNICSSNITGAGNNVGILVGYANGASITSSYAESRNISGVHNVGGLVGSGLFARITTSSAGSGTINGDSYVGGLVGSGGRATITSSYAVSEAVRGTSNVGGLVGDGSSAIVTLSYAESRTISGDSHVGGLIGSGGSAAITSSYAESRNVSGDSHVGGLFGSGGRATITSSYAESRTVSGNSYIGGLVGSGGSAIINLSYAVSEAVRGTDGVGGLVGSGESASITSSYAVSEAVSGDDFVGGLIGSGGSAAITSSYAANVAVSGTNSVGGLVGSGNLATVTSSYWDSSSSEITEGSYGLPKTTRELQSPTNSVGIYTSWTTRCADDSLAWNFGTSSQYPVLTCTSGEITAQRSYTRARISYKVTGLAAISSDSSATLSWNNPHVQIASISISYRISGSNDAPLISRSTKIAPNTNVQHTIGGLTNGEYYTFTVSVTLRDDSAGKERAGVSINVAIGPNYDGDSFADFVDVDADGDGLIEIATAEQFNQIRHNLLGSSFIISQGGIGNSIGCGNGKDITACNGYELIADISLVDYDWEPIGSCPTYAGSTSTCTDTSALFNGVFDGNGLTISDLIITRSSGDYANAIGLFGAIGPNAQLRNIHIRSSSIISFDINVGMLVGYARGASITNSSLSDGFVIGRSAVGGLVGEGSGASITSAYVTGGYVNGVDFIGGLVGRGDDANITSSYAMSGSVTGELLKGYAHHVGGLVGSGEGASITLSYAAGGPVSGDNFVGGLVGSGYGASITSSYAAGGPVSGVDNIGGLVGRGYGASITSSYAAGGSVSGVDNVGGLVGYGSDANITLSYAAGGPVSGVDNVGGLVGEGSDAVITSSYTAGGAVSGQKRVGGLVGYGSSAVITLSYAAGGSVSGQQWVGGLVGVGVDATIMSSYAAGGPVSGDNFVGGLVGYGNAAIIKLSYAAFDSIRGNNWVGGLVGDGSGANIVSSYATGGSVGGNNWVGGLVGDGSGATIELSYAAGGSVGGNNWVGGLVGEGTGANIAYSYWDSTSSGITEGSYGLPKTTSELQSPINFNGSIYATWEEFECDDGSRAWNLGTSFQYPALTCIPGELTAQRSYAIAYHSYVVEGLQAIASDSNVTLSWNNPHAQIESISVSYKISDSNDPPLTKNVTEIAPNINVQLAIDELTPEEYYTFTVSLTLDSIYAVNGGTESSISIAIGPDYDGDGLADFVDPDDDNDGVEDHADAFPFDSTESRDSDNDGMGNNVDEDDDGDGKDDDVDVDDDGDGLIEIATAEQFNQIRHNLLGSDFTLVQGGMGNASGCGNGTMGGDITACNGYELVADISLADYDDWKPIGSCPTYDDNTFTCTDTSALFNSIFDGNGWTISNLTITNSNGDYNNAAGLFGAISSDAQLRNIHIRASNITGAVTNVGMLVGYAGGASIINSSVSDMTLSGTGTSVGGLVGYGQTAAITSSYVRNGSVSGDVYVGGLVGDGRSANITSSYARNRIVNGAGTGRDAGGLVGAGEFVTITLSYAMSMAVEGNSSIGGLVGWGEAATITSSYANIGSVVGATNNVGGLIGSGVSARVTSSYAVSGSVAGSVAGGISIGGLIGGGNGGTRSSHSYWDRSTSGIKGGSFGLPKTTIDLTNPTSSVGIYGTWKEKCADGSFAWDFGTYYQYPALTCTPGGAAAQR